MSPSLTEQVDTQTLRICIDLPEDPEFWKLLAEKARKIDEQNFVAPDHYTPQQALVVAFNYDGFETLTGAFREYQKATGCTSALMGWWVDSDVDWRDPTAIASAELAQLAEELDA